MVADELRRQADEFVDLTQLAQRIGRDPSERMQRSPDQRRPQTPYNVAQQAIDDPVRD
jgi:hypothetical protein